MSAAAELRVATSIVVGRARNLRNRMETVAYAVEDHYGWAVVTRAPAGRSAGQMVTVARYSSGLARENKEASQAHVNRLLVRAINSGQYPRVSLSRLTSAGGDSTTESSTTPTSEETTVDTTEVTVDPTDAPAVESTPDTTTEAPADGDNDPDREPIAA